jgi:hypothetical protein
MKSSLKFRGKTSESEMEMPVSTVSVYIMGEMKRNEECLFWFWQAHRINEIMLGANKNVGHVLPSEGTWEIRREPLP